jgi:hypothetical protein
MDMRRILLAALASLTLAAPAMAQYYSPYDGWRPPSREDWDEPRYERSPYDRPGWDGPGWNERPRWREERRMVRRGRAGNVCVTSRGSCEYPTFMPLNSGCRCDIPGFGPKRGNILE